MSQLYAERDAMELDAAGGFYIRHVTAMTKEELHNKSDIAAELGWRDMRIAGLEAKCAALASELDAIVKQSEAVYEAGYNHGHLHTVDGIAYADCVKDDFLALALQVIAETDTPETNKFMADAKAQGVELFANTMRDTGDDAFFDAIATACANAAVKFAEQLRKEAVK